MCNVNRAPDLQLFKSDTQLIDSLVLIDYNGQVQNNTCFFRVT